MKTNEVIEYFGGRKKLLAALNLKTRQTIYAWGEFVPAHRQYQIEIITNGALKADIKDRAAA